MVDWWTEEDANEYESRVDVMVQQVNKFEVHGQAVKGKLTSGEVSRGILCFVSCSSYVHKLRDSSLPLQNIADLGGLRLALRALINTKCYDPALLIDGFTPIQRFFLSWAQCWRQNITKERALRK